MFTRFVARLVAAVAAVVAGMALFARAALAVILPAPGAPLPAPAPAPHRLTAVATPSDTVMVLGMDWQLALSVALFVLAAVLFVAATVQHRRVAHPGTA